MAPYASLSDAAGTGDRIAALRTLRDRLARDLDECSSARDVGTLSQRLMDVLAQIDELGGGVKPKREDTPLDEFTKRLHARKSAPKAARRASGS